MKLKAQAKHRLTGGLIPPHKPSPLSVPSQPASQRLIDMSDLELIKARFQVESLIKQNQDVLNQVVLEMNRRVNDEEVKKASKNGHATVPTDQNTDGRV